MATTDPSYGDTPESGGRACALIMEFELHPKTLPGFVDFLRIGIPHGINKSP